MKFALLILALLSVQISRAQNVVWAEGVGFNGSGNDGGHDIMVDDSGNVYMAGFAKNDAFAGAINLPGFGEHDLLLVKYDPNGNVLWAKRHGSTDSDQYRSVAQDAAGNIYAFGYFTGNCDFGTTTINLTGTRDAVLVKYGPGGTIKWIKVMEGGYAGFTNVGSMSVECHQGKVYVGGTFTGSINIDGNVLTPVAADEIFVAKFDTSGLLDTARRFGNVGIDVFHHLEVAGPNEIYLSGYSNDFISFDGIFHNNSSTSWNDPFLVKCNGNWDPVWVRSIGGTLNQFIVDIEVDPWGNVIITGFYGDSVVWNGGEVTLTADFTDSYIIRLNSNGDLLNSKSFGGQDVEIVARMAVDNDGSIYLSGMFKVDFSYDSFYDVLSSTRDLFIMKVDSSLNFEWFTKYAGYEASGKKASMSGIDVDSCGHIYFTGNWMDTVWYDQVQMIASGTSLDAITAKMTPPLTADFLADTVHICPGTTVQFTDYSSCSAISWDWSFPGGDIDSSSQQHPQVTYNTQGLYDVELIVFDGATYDTLLYTSYMVVGCPGIDELEKPEFSIYPNPNRGTFAVALTSGLNTPVQIMVHDLSGKVISRWDNVQPGGQLSVGDISNGTYVVTLTHGGMTSSELLIITR